MYRFFVLCALLVACGSPGEKNIDQRQKVARAEHMLKEERARLEAMQDSLSIKIKQNMTQLRLTAEQAEAIERTLIESQKAIVIAAERNVQAQRAFLDSLQKYGP